MHGTKRVRSVKLGTARVLQTTRHLTRYYKQLQSYESKKKAKTLTAFKSNSNFSTFRVTYMYRVLAKAVHHEPPIDICVAKHCHVQILYA